MSDLPVSGQLDPHVAAALQIVHSFLQQHSVPLQPSPPLAAQLTACLGELRDAVTAHGLGPVYEHDLHLSRRAELGLASAYAPHSTSLKTEANIAAADALAAVAADAAAAIKAHGAAQTKNDGSSGGADAEADAAAVTELWDAVCGPESKLLDIDPATAALRNAAVATCGVAASPRAAVWKLLITGPFLAALYTVGSEAAHAYTSKDKKDKTGSSTDPEQQSAANPAAGSETALSLAAAYLRSWTSASEYISLTTQGPSKRFPLIRDDSFRTFNTSDREASPFLNNVPEQAIARVCTAFDRKFAGDDWQYCQGMNVYAGVFLYIMPELDAFNAFSLFCTQAIPLYWRANHIGVEAGCHLIDKLLASIDPDLYTHLASGTPSLTAILYAFPCVKTMSATVAPLHEAVRLWDTLLAMGPAASLYCVVAQLVLMRDRLIGLETPKTLLDYRKWPPLQAGPVAELALRFIKRHAEQEPELLRDAVLHMVHDATVGKIARRENWLAKKAGGL